MIEEDSGTEELDCTFALELKTATDELDIPPDELEDLTTEDEFTCSPLEDISAEDEPSPSGSVPLFPLSPSHAARIRAAATMPKNIIRCFRFISFLLLAANRPTEIIAIPKIALLMIVCKQTITSSVPYQCIFAVPAVRMPDAAWATSSNHFDTPAISAENRDGESFPFAEHPAFVEAEARDYVHDVCYNVSHKTVLAIRGEERADGSERPRG